MKLLYLYVKNYKCLNNFEINFTKDYKFEFDKGTKKLTGGKITPEEETSKASERGAETSEDKMPEALDNDAKSNKFEILPDGLDITAIIGKNGTGKTSVLECLLEIFYDRVNAFFLGDSIKYICIYQNNELYYRNNIELINKTSLTISKTDEFNYCLSYFCDFSTSQVFRKIQGSIGREYSYTTPTKQANQLPYLNNYKEYKIDMLDQLYQAYQKDAEIFYKINNIEASIPIFKYYRYESNLIESYHQLLNQTNDIIVSTDEISNYLDKYCLITGRKQFNATSPDYRGISSVISDLDHTLITPDVLSNKLHPYFIPIWIFYSTYYVLNKIQSNYLKQKSSEEKFDPTGVPGGAINFNKPYKESFMNDLQELSLSLDKAGINEKTVYKLPNFICDHLMSENFYEKYQHCGIEDLIEENIKPHLNKISEEDKYRSEVIETLNSNLIYYKNGILYSDMTLIEHGIKKRDEKFKNLPPIVRNTLDINLLPSKEDEHDYISLSDGQKVLLNTLCKIIDKSNYLDNNIQTILMDEPMQSYHPEWQRKFIYYLTRLKQDFFSDKDIQFIITTHSPLMVSDLPKENIIRLETDKDGHSIVRRNETETFGGNILQLMKDDFFMDYTIGEFARTKIKEFLSKLEAEDITQTEAKAFTAQIGDELIKSMLEHRVKEAFNA
jgi:predicted ATP-binding protein involved in virulence